MAKITYQGESDAISWYGQSFAKGKAIETDNADLIAKAQRNRFFATVAMADKDTKAEIEAMQAAQKEAEAKAKADAEEEARRVLDRNANYLGRGEEDDGSTDDSDDEEQPQAVSSAPEGPVAPVAPRRGRPAKK